MHFAKRKKPFLYDEVIINREQLHGCQGLEAQGECDYKGHEEIFVVMELLSILIVLVDA